MIPSGYPEDLEFPSYFSSNYEFPDKGYFVGLARLSTTVDTAQFEARISPENFYVVVFDGFIAFEAFTMDVSLIGFVNIS